MAGADAIIAGFNTKYVYNFWRPITAIRAADTDGNPLTTADPAWTPLVATPAHPDYNSNHALYSSAAATVLASFFDDDDLNFSLTTSTSPGSAVRSYHSFSQAADECGRARIYVGFHFRAAVEDGLKQGRHIGNWTFRKFLTPIERQHEAECNGK
jgi:hypothetical protein